MIMVQVTAQVEAVGPGHTLDTITTEADRYNVSSMATLTAHTPLRLRAGDMPVCVREREGAREQRLLIDLFFRLFS